MRSIKFRAWCYKTKKMHYYVNVGDSELIKLINVNDGDNIMTGWKYIPKPDVHIMQFTGMKDKYDGEICEGDIIRTFEHFEHPVIFKNGAFGYTTLDNPFVTFAENDNFEWDHNKSRRIEIMGNIYETY